MNIPISWSNLKSIYVNIKKLNLQHIQLDSRYYLFITEKGIIYDCTIFITTPRNPDQIDFEDNYLSQSNKQNFDFVSLRDGNNNLTITSEGKLQVESAPTYLSTFDPLSACLTVTAPTFPLIKPVAYYTVPAGKTLKIYGYSIKGSIISSMPVLYKNKCLWKFSVAVPTPGVTTLVQKTIPNSGLTLLSTYRYKIVAVNILGKTIGGTEASITLTTTNNAVTLTWAVVAGALYYEVYRTLANGVINSEKYLTAVETLTFTDVIPDSELGIDIPPIANTTAGNINGDNYIAGMGASIVTIDTLYGISLATTLDIIYKDIYGKRRHMTSLTGTTVILGGVQLLPSGFVNPTLVTKIPVLSEGKEYASFAINDIISVSNTPVTGSFGIYGKEILIIDSPKAALATVTNFLPIPISVSAGEEIVLGFTGTIATAANNAFMLYAKLI